MGDFLYFIKFNMFDIGSYENKSINVLISTDRFIIFLLLKMVENKIQALKKKGINNNCYYLFMPVLVHYLLVPLL